MLQNYFVIHAVRSSQRAGKLQMNPQRGDHHFRNSQRSCQAGTRPFSESGGRKFNVVSNSCLQFVHL